MRKKTFSNFISKIVERNIREEANSVCVMIGYQPFMPDSVLKYKERKESNEKFM